MMAFFIPSLDSGRVQGRVGNSSILHKPVDQSNMGSLGNLGSGKNRENPGKGRLVRKRLPGPEPQDPAQGRVGFQTPDQGAGRGQVQDRFGHKGPTDRPPVVRRTPGPAPVLLDLILDPDDLEKGHDLAVLVRQRTQTILDSRKQGSLNASPDRGKLHRTSCAMGGDQWIYYTLQQLKIKS